MKLMSHEKRNGVVTVAMAFSMLFASSLALFALMFSNSEYIFSDGFENGFSAWTGTWASTGAIAKVTQISPKEGAYHAYFATGGKADVENAYVYKSLDSGRDELYIRAYFYFADINLGVSDILLLMRLYNSNGSVAFLGIKNRTDTGNSQGTARWYVVNAKGWQVAYGSAVQENHYYCVEFHVRVSGASGETSLYVDGVKDVERTGLDTDDYGLIDKIRMGIVVTDDYSGNNFQDYSLHMDSVVIDDQYIGAIQTNLPQSYVILTFDDNTQRRSYDESVAIMNEFGYRGVLFLVTGWVHQEDIPLWNSLRNSGWEIGCHTWTHPFVTNLTAEDLQHEISDSKTWLEDALGVQIISFAYPGSRGSDNQTVWKVLAESGYLYAREGDWHQDWNGTSSFMINSWVFTNDTYQTKIEGLIKDSRENGVAVAMFHGIDQGLTGWGALTPDQFSYCLNRIKNEGLQVVTFKEWLELSSVRITLEPLGTTLAYQVAGQDFLFTAPDRIAFSDGKWYFVCWKDGEMAKTRLLDRGGNYTVIYRKSV